MVYPVGFKPRTAEEKDRARKERERQALQTRLWLQPPKINLPKQDVLARMMTSKGVSTKEYVESGTAGRQDLPSGKGIVEWTTPLGENRVRLGDKEYSFMERWRGGASKISQFLSPSGLPEGEVPRTPREVIQAIGMSALMAAPGVGAPARAVGITGKALQVAEAVDIALNPLKWKGGIESLAAKKTAKVIGKVAPVTPEARGLTVIDSESTFAAEKGQRSIQAFNVEGKEGSLINYRELSDKVLIESVSSEMGGKPETMRELLRRIVERNPGKPLITTPLTRSGQRYIQRLEKEGFIEVSKLSKSEADAITRRFGRVSGEYAEPVSIIPKVEVAVPLAKIPKLTANLMPDLQNFDEVVRVASQPDKLRELSSLPFFKPIAERIGGKSATAVTPTEWAIVGRRVLQQEGATKAMGAISSLQRFGNSKSIFKLDEKGMTLVGGKKVALNDVRTYPQRYLSKLTEPQKQWVEQASVLEKDKLSLLKRNGIKINELPLDEGGEYAGRRVYVKLASNGEVLEMAFVGTGVRRPGAKAAFEKTRIFPTQGEAIKEGYRYLPEEETLMLNIQASYNRVADKRMTDWLLDKIPFRTAGATELTKANRLLQVTNQVAKGKTPSTERWRLIFKEYPDYAKRLKDVGKTGEGGEALKSEVEALYQKVQLDWNTLTSAEQKAQRAYARAPHLGEATVQAPAFAGKILTGSEARATAQALRQEFEPSFSKALNAVNQVNAVGRMMALAGDASPATIQLLFMAGAYPKQYGKAMGGFVRALFDPEFLPRYLFNHSETIAKSRNLILTTGGTTEFTEALARGGLLRKRPFKLVGKVLEPFQRGYETALDVAGIEMRESLDYLATTPERANQVEAFINEFRGLLSSKKLGLSQTQRQLETASLLAPQYTRASAALLFDLARGNLRGSLARKSMAKGVTAVLAMGVALSYALGEDEEEMLEHLNPTSPKFQTWNILGQNLGPGTKVRAIAKVFGQSAKNPDDLLKLSMENPSLRFVRGNLSPAISTGFDLLTGKNYIGDPSRDGLLSLSKTVIAENMLPIWIQSVALEGGDIPQRVTRGAAEFAGLRTSPMSPSQLRDIEREKVAQKSGYTSWEEMGKAEEAGKLAQTKALQKEPILQKLTTAAEKAYAQLGTEEGKTWTSWRESGQGIEKKYQDAVKVAVKEFNQTRDGSLFREKIDDAAKIRRDDYVDISKTPEYSEIYAYFSQPLTEEQKRNMSPLDVARREYYNAMYSPKMFDQFGNYLFDKAEEKESAFILKYGQRAKDYIEEFQGIKWPDKPVELKLLERAREILKPYWQIEDKIWSMYPQGTKELADQISQLETTNPTKARQMLKQVPQILRARELIASYKKQLKARNPLIKQALDTFYR